MSYYSSPKVIALIVFLNERMRYINRWIILAMKLLTTLEIKMKKISEYQDLMTLKELAHYMRRKPATIYSWRSRGIEMPASIRTGKRGARVLYKRSDVEAWVNKLSSDCNSDRQRGAK